MKTKEESQNLRVDWSKVTHVQPCEPEKSQRVTGEIFEGQEIPFNLHEPIRQLLAQRDELLVACKLSLFKLEEMAQLFGNKWPMDLSPVKAETKLRAVIANAEGR